MYKVSCLLSCEALALKLVSFWPFNSFCGCSSANAMLSLAYTACSPLPQPNPIIGQECDLWRQLWPSHMFIHEANVSIHTIGWYFCLSHDVVFLEKSRNFEDVYTCLVGAPAAQALDVYTGPGALKRLID